MDTYVNAPVVSVSEVRSGPPRLLKSQRNVETDTEIAAAKRQADTRRSMNTCCVHPHGHQFTLAIRSLPQPVTTPTHIKLYIYILVELKLDQQIQASRILYSHVYMKPDKLCPGLNPGPTLFCVHTLCSHIVSHH